MRVVVLLLLVVAVSLGVWMSLTGEQDPTPQRGEDSRAEVAVGEVTAGLENNGEEARPLTEGIEVRPAPTTATITGLVTADGKPVSGVDVFVCVIHGGDNHRSMTARSGADGRYELTDVPTGEVMVYVLGGGYASKGLASARRKGANSFLLQVEPGEQCELDLEVEPAAMIAGRVKEAAENPLFRQADVTLNVADVGWGGLRGRGFLQPTDHDGRFRFSSLAPGLAYQISAEIPDALPATSGPHRARSGEQITVDLSSPPSRTLQITVLEEGSGVPIADAVIKVHLTTGPATRGLPGEWRTDANGIARVSPVPLGWLKVEASTRDHVKNRELQLIPDSEKGDLAFTVHLAKGIHISGRVFRPDGSSFDSEQLRVRRVEPERGLTVYDRTTADGSFSVRGLTPGLYEFTVSYPVADPPICRVRVDADASDLTVRLKASPVPESELRPKVQVRIVDAAGHPVPRGRIITFKLTPGSISTSSTGFRDGLFDADIEDDAHEFWLVVYDAKDRDGKRLEWLVHGPSKPGPATLTFTLRPALMISGTVIDAKGKPVRGVEVRARPASGRLPFKWDNGMRSEFATCHSGRNGTFRVEGLGAGRYELVITPSRDFAPCEPIAAEGGSEGVRIVLTAGASATLRVLDWSERPVAGASVVAMVPDPERTGDWTGAVGETTDQDGRVTLRGLDSTKRYRLEVASPPNRTDLKVMEIMDWSPADGDLRMDRAYVVRGVVRTPAGKPIPDLTVWRKTGKSSWTGMSTEVGGAFLFGGLDAGPVVLKVGHPSYQPARSPEVTVQAGDEDVVLIHDP